MCTDATGEVPHGTQQSLARTYKTSRVVVAQLRSTSRYQAGSPRRMSIIIILVTRLGRNLVMPIPMP